MTSTLDTILAKYTAAGNNTKDKTLGAAFVVVNKDGVLYSSSAGRIDFAADARPWDLNSFTYVASMTKLITCTAVMQLVERGLVGLDDDLRSTVPQLAKMQILRGFDGDEQPILEENTTPITLRMLLTHTVGLGYDVADADLMKWHKAVGRTATNLDATIEGFATPLKFTPGEGWYYGTAIDWAGQALEKITGKTLGEYLSQNIFAPVGMKDTGFWPEKLPHVAERTAAWQYRGDDGFSLSPGPAPRNIAADAIDSGGAGLWTTAKDYGVFLRALLREELVKKETLDEMFIPQLEGKQAKMMKELADAWGTLAVEFSPDMELNHSLAGCVNMQDAPGKRKKGSLQWSGMCNSHWWMDRETGVAATLIVQSLPHGDPVVNKLYDELERAVYGELLGQQA
ncbi:acyltransferase mlcH [Colletotrichum spaethianum]|uniref:Acyltransferase mlcH n=1 Tax=Colletotrichum spaethianum TaxID=700344 RepID=A0AA37USD4_9PEZI|nr:acyltransferase mlcH [Colletotrichum spaethianum]GKT49728.1 acyltransferase mlcH [Colletotrichum spaethianum]